MATKTNKMFTKRLRVTKNGKVLARREGKNHFNAKESRGAQLAGKRMKTVVLTTNEIGHYMPLA